MSCENPTTVLDDLPFSLFEGEWSPEMIDPSPVSNLRPRQIPTIPECSEVALHAAEIQQENIRQLVEENKGHHVDRRGGPRLLLLAVLKDAVNTLERWCRNYNNLNLRAFDLRHMRVEAMAAHEYLMSESQKFVTTFVNVCDAMNINHEVLRRLILRRMDPEAIQRLVPE